MPSIYRSLDAGFLPDDLAGILRRRLREVAGLALLAIAALAGAALATWSVKDPSLSHATAAPVRNLVGGGGAIAADLMMQLIGFASLIVVALPAGWGWRLITHRTLDREGLRLAAWLGGIVLTAGFAACLPRGGAWPLPTGLGGVVGDALLRGPALLLGGPLAGVSRLTIAVVLGVGAAAVVAFALGFGFQVERKARVERNVLDRDDEEADEADRADGAGERAFVSIGWLVHEFLSMKARLARVMTFSGLRRMTAPPSAPRGASRVEPRLVAGATSIDDAIDLEEAEEDEVERKRAARRRDDVSGQAIRAQHAQRR